MRFTSIRVGDGYVPSNLSGVTGLDNERLNLEIYSYTVEGNRFATYSIPINSSGDNDPLYIREMALYIADPNDEGNRDADQAYAIASVDLTTPGNDWYIIMPPSGADMLVSLQLGIHTVISEDAVIIVNTNVVVSGVQGVNGADPDEFGMVWLTPWVKSVNSIAPNSTTGNIALPISKPNILQNWDFRGRKNPVNQRDQNVYEVPPTGHQYTIDRWLLNSGAQIGSVTVNNDFITISKNSISPSNLVWRQFVENPSVYSGKTVTVSTLARQTGSAQWSVGVEIDGWTLGGSTNRVQLPNELSIVSHTYDIPELSAVSSLGVSFVSIGGTTGSGSADILVVKLELGSVSTLAHEDTPMDPMRELEVCLRYQQPIQCLMGHIAATPGQVFALFFGNISALRATPVPSLLFTEPTEDNFILSSIHLNPIGLQMNIASITAGRVFVNRIYFLDANL